MKNPLPKLTALLARYCSSEEGHKIDVIFDLRICFPPSIVHHKCTSYVEMAVSSL